MWSPCFKPVSCRSRSVAMIATRLSRIEVNATGVPEWRGGSCFLIRDAWEEVKHGENPRVSPKKRQGKVAEKLSDWQKKCLGGGSALTQETEMATFRGPCPIQSARAGESVRTPLSGSAAAPQGLWRPGPARAAAPVDSSVIPVAPHRRRPPLAESADDVVAHRR